MERLVRKLYLLHAVGDLLLLTLLFAMVMIYRLEPSVIAGSSPLPAVAVCVIFGIGFVMTGLRIRRQMIRFVLVDDLLLLLQILAYVVLTLLVRHPLVFLVSMLFTPVLSQWTPRNAAVTIIVTGVFTTAIAFLSWPSNWHAIFGIAIIPAQLFLMHFVRTLLHEADIQQTLEEKNRELQATQNLLSQIAAQDERIRIARDMHDVLGHGLTALSIQAELLTHETSGKVQEQVKSLHTQARQLLADVRETVSVIREPREYDLESVLQRLVDNIVKPTTRLEMAGINIEQPQHAEVLLRCVQEGTANAIRHSGAETILVSLAGRSDSIHLIIRDDGCGMEPDPHSFGNGLKGLSERVYALKGKFEVHSRKNEGTTLEVILPLESQ